MNKKSTKRLLKISLFLALVLPIFSFAQINLPDNFPKTADYLKINMRPENPRPNERVSLNLELYTTDLKKAEISWFLNGELQEKGFGLTDFSLNSGNLGQRQVVSVLIETFEGEQVRKELIIRPADVVLVWNANTYTPPFYRGRALLTGQGGGLEVIAIPNIVDGSGNKIDSEALNYKWYKDNTFLINQSGFGKNSVKLREDLIPRSFNMKVIVSTIDNSISAEKVRQVRYKEPTVLVYENNPLYGILFNKTVEQTELKSEEMTLSAIPYFFSGTIKTGGFTNYIWKQNGQNLSQSAGQSSVTFRKTDANSSGIVNIEVSVKNENDYRQSAVKKLNIEIK